MPKYINSGNYFSNSRTQYGGTTAMNPTKDTTVLHKSFKSESEPYASHVSRGDTCFKAPYLSHICAKKKNKKNIINSN